MAKGLALVLRVGLVLCLAIPPGYALGADLDPKVQAKSRFQAGQSHYNLNEFNEALQEFKEAYRLYPDPIFLYNLGQCERQLDHYEEAMLFYRSYLRNLPKAPNKAEVQRKIEEMETALKTKNAAAAQPDSATPPTSTQEPPPAKDDAAATSPSVTSTSAPPPIATEPLPAATTAPVVPVVGTPAPSASDTAPSSSPMAESVPETPPTPPGVANLEQTAVPVVAAAPFYKTWWFWTATGVAVAGTVTAIVLSASSGSSGPPDATLGGKKVY